MEFAKRAERNMWVIIVTICFVATYTTLYSIVLLIWGGEHCLVFQSKWGSSLSTMVERFLEYIAWVYPLIYLLWPAEATCCSRKRDSRVVSGDIPAIV